MLERSEASFPDKAYEDFREQIIRYAHENADAKFLLLRNDRIYYIK